MSIATKHLPYVLALDIGSSSVRATIYDARARVVPGLTVATPHVTPTTSDGGAVEDPIGLARVVEQALDEIMRLAGKAAYEIVAVGLDTFVGNLLGVDADRNPTTPVYTYADTRSKAEVSQMRHDLDAVAIHQRTGAMLHTAYAPARLKWIRRTEPEAWDKTKLWTNFASFLYSRWFGVDAACSSSVASWSGLMNRHTGKWDDELLEYADVSEVNAFAFLLN